MNIKAILFDIDGTLVDSNGAHIRAWEDAFEGVGKRFERSVVQNQMGKGADMLLPTLLPDLDEKAKAALTTAQGDSFNNNYRDGIKPFPKARALIAHAHKLGQKVVFASSASKDDLEHYLDLLDVREYVDAATTSDDVEKTKPAPDIFSTALAKLPGLSASDVLVVGDTPYDIEAAKKAGIQTVALRSGGFSDEALEKAGALAIYDDVSALLVDYERSPLGQ
jgi:HAD superfamily hydrolase (TIGR01509 family)